MNHGLFIAGDWGTTRLRLYLCDGKKVLDRKTGAGISKLKASPANSLFSLIKPWGDAYGKCPIFLSGMVGSNLGWITTPYADCPATAESLSSELTHIEHEGYDVYITSGLTCTNMMGSPDVMRGEETQILGLMELNKGLKKGTHLLCLPGTHTKWVILENGTIIRFLTALTGELYALLLDHSILVHDTAEEGPECDKAFEQGARRSAELSEGDLLHSLFEVRSRQISQELTSKKAAAYLSGMIIGRDVSGIIRLLDKDAGMDNPVTIIGAPHLTRSYKAAFDIHAISAIEQDGSTAVIAGLQAIQRAKQKRRTS